MGADGIDITGEMRADAALVARGLAANREAAKRIILAGEVLLNREVVKKPSVLVKPDDTLVCKAEPLRYVGRGGLKLEKALKLGGYDLTGLRAVDIGASTGGFTDCMLQHGAAFVYAVDVGHGQLHQKLAGDFRVLNMEGTDIRDTGLVSGAIAPESIDFCAIDVSFISVTKLFDFVIPYLKKEADAVCLIKPQFEAGRGAVGKRGVVRDKAVHIKVIEDLIAFFRDRDFGVVDITYSPITGGQGNIEYLALLRRGFKDNRDFDIPSVVEAAWSLLCKD